MTFLNKLLFKIGLHKALWSHLKGFCSPFQNKFLQQDEGPPGNGTFLAKEEHFMTCWSDDESETFCTGAMSVKLYE